MKAEILPENSLVLAKRAMYDLRPFIGRKQLELLGEHMLSKEEGLHWQDKVLEIQNTIMKMPKTYQQDGLGMDAVVHLHYFVGGANWYITERDKSGDGSLQAFGYANLFGGHGNGELGYICIYELIQADVELDLYWEPKTLREIKDQE